MSEQGKSKSFYQQDILLIVVFILMTWLVLGFVINKVARLANSLLVAGAAGGAGIITGIFMTGALLAVVVHLKKNSIRLYWETDGK